MTQICINLSKTSVEIAEVSRSSELVIRKESMHFSDEREIQIKDELKAFLENNNFKKEYDEYSLSWNSKNSSLVPMNVFQESSAEDIYRLSFGDKTSSSTIDYNRIVMENVVNVFDIPLWAKSFFVIQFPRIVIQHDVTHQIHGIFNGPTFKLLMHLSLKQDYFTLTAVHHSKLIFFNSFDYTNNEDILYYVINMIQKKELIGEKGSIVLSGIENKVNSVEEFLTENKNRIQEFKKIEILTDIDAPFKNQLLCV